MATYTSNYAWTKPSGNDNVDISVLNANLDSQDSIMHDAFANMAQAFSESSTYEVGDIVVYGTTTYKCHTAVTTAGSWTGSTNWQVYKLSEGGSGGGGTSNYNDLTNKPSINGVTLSGNKTASDLSLQDKMQYSTMPTASADNEGKIYQYVGTTDSNYTNGYYYKCVENSGSYSWQLVENINDQTPTFTEASTRNNIASGEKLSVIMGKIAKFFNDLKTVAFSGNASDLNYDNTTSGLSATKTQGAVDEVAEEKADKSDIAPEFNTTTAYAKGDLCYHEGTLYEFNQAHAAGAWNNAEADETDVDEVIDGCAAIGYRVESQVTTDGVKTWKEIINQLFNGVTVSATGDWRIRNGSDILHLGTSSSSTKEFCRINGATSQYVLEVISYHTASSHDNTFYNQLNLKPNTAISITDLTSVAPAKGTTIYLLNRQRSNP